MTEPSQLVEEVRMTRAYQIISRRLNKRSLVECRDQKVQVKLYQDAHHNCEQLKAVLVYLVVERKLTSDEVYEPIRTCLGNSSLVQYLDDMWREPEPTPVKRILPRPLPPRMAAPQGSAMPSFSNPVQA